MAKVNGNTIHLKGLVASIDGRKVIKSDIAGKADKASVIGRDLAENILKKGADKILDDIIT
jgi:hydroxymethylbilane synthase